METFKSDISGIEFPMHEKVNGNSIRKSIFDVIHKSHPSFTTESSLALSELNRYRELHIAALLSKQLGELSDLDKTVIESLSDRTLITEKINDDDKDKTTLGQKLADKVASFGGSWTFISAFAFFLFAWICINVLFFSNKGFDPYPFILLNLILSCIAAIQAPIIMMSQNRQEEKDRERAKQDYMVNLKSELEIRALHEKIDHFVIHQQQELLEIQKLQIDMMNDILKKMGKNE